MAMTSCHECGHQISTSASACPSCGAKVPRTKWWLWGPLGLIGVFVLYGLSIPEYESRASEVRRACEQIGGPMNRHTCDALYAQQMTEGRNNGGRIKGHEAPVDRALVERTEKARAAEATADLKDCQKTLPAKRAQYDELIAKREYWSASLALRVCAEALEDPALKRLVADAEIKQYVLEIESPSTSKDAKRQARAALQRDYPEEAQKVAKR